MDLPRELPSRPPSKDEIIEALLPAADRISFLFPDLDRTLSQARMDVDPITHLAESIFRGLSTGAMIGLSLIAIGLMFQDMFLLKLSAGLAPTAGLFGFYTYAKLPDIRAKKRVRNLEKELPYALRHVLIEVKAGVSIYEALVSASEGYGEASEEFEKIVRDINSGVSEIEALERAVVRNPSLQFRRALWQIINALKSGSDVSKTLESLVDAIVEQQILEVQKYGKELNPYTLMYLMIAVIIPSLGVTFLMVLSTFTGINVGETVFYGILAGLIMFQFIFMNMVKAKRPKVKA